MLEEAVRSRAQSGTGKSRCRGKEQVHGETGGKDWPKKTEGKEEVKR